MIQSDDVRESRAKLETAKRRFDSAGAGYGREDIKGTNYYPGEYFTHCQRAIEHATKAIFLLLSVDVPSDHFIEMDSNSVSDLLNASEAGLCEGFLDRMEANQAYNHADEVLTVSEKIIERGAEIAGIA